MPFELRPGLGHHSPDPQITPRSARRSNPSNSEALGSIPATMFERTRPGPKTSTERANARTHCAQPPLSRSLPGQMAFQMLRSQISMLCEMVV